MKVSFDLPEAIHSKYTADAERLKKTLNEVLKDRLVAAQDLPFRPIVITPTDRAAIEGIACRNLDSGKDILDILTEAVRMDLSEVHIDFTLDDLTQMEQHAGFYGETLQECLERVTPDFVDFMLSRA